MRRIVYHCTLNRRTTVCGRNLDNVNSYVGMTYWVILRASNRCKQCMRIRPPGKKQP